MIRNLTDREASVLLAFMEERITRQELREQILKEFLVTGSILKGLLALLWDDA